MDDEATETTEITPTGTDRRSALKKAAIAAGVVAWTTPAVQAVTGRAAHAQTLTNCAPVLKANVQNTGPTCACAPDAPGPSCCSDNTYFITVTATCGALCPGNATVTVTSISGKAKPGCKDGISFRELNCPGGTDTITIGANVTCPDGQMFKVSQPLLVTCIPCNKVAAASTPLVDELPSELSEEPSLGPVEDEVPPEETPPETPPPETPPPEQETPPAGETPPAEGSDAAEQQGSETIP